MIHERLNVCRGLKRYALQRNAEPLRDHRSGAFLRVGLLCEVEHVGVCERALARCGLRNQAGVDASGEKDPYRNITGERELDRTIETLAKSVQRVRHRSRQITGLGLPVDFAFTAATAIQARGGGWQALDIGHHGPLARHVVEAEVVAKGDAVDSVWEIA